MSAMDNRVMRARSLGFDTTRVIGFNDVRVGCSQCAAVCVNGVPVHEQGCPNQTFECKGCNARVPRRGAYCPDCQ